MRVSVTIVLPAGGNGIGSLHRAYTVPRGQSAVRGTGLGIRAQVRRLPRPRFQDQLPRLAHVAQRPEFHPPFPTLVRAFEKLLLDMVIDGEIVALNAAGRPSFNLLQNYQTAAQTIVFYAFDLLVLSGRNLDLLRFNGHPRSAKVGAIGVDDEATG